MLGLCDQLLGSALNPKHHSIIDRCVKNLYFDAKKWESAFNERFLPYLKGAVRVGGTGACTLPGAFRRGLA
jgi:hypothetical protein